MVEHLGTALTTYGSTTSTSFNIVAPINEDTGLVESITIVPAS